MLFLTAIARSGGVVGAALLLALPIASAGRADAASLPYVSPTSTISGVAGNGVGAFSGDGGPARLAQVNQPRDTDLGPDGSLYVADTYNHRVRRIAPDGTITTVAGTGVAGYSGDGGLATQAKIYWPHDVLVDDSGVIYIADSANHRIRRVALDGTITTIAGRGLTGFSGDGGQATAARLKNPKGLALFDGKLFIADGNNNRIRQVDLATGVITTVAGNGTKGYSGDGGPATSAALAYPQRIAVDDLGRIYIADSDNHRIRRFTPGGSITTVAGNGIAGTSGDGGLATQARLSNPRGVEVVGTEAIYIADSQSDRIRMVNLDTGIISAVAATGIRGYSGDGGLAGAARMYNPRGVTVDPSGRLYVADSFNSAIRVITPTTTVNAEPAADFTVDCQGTRCSVDAALSRDPDGFISAYRWSFGDGAEAMGRTTSHAFDNEGTFAIELTVTDDRGATATATRQVLVANAAPVASFATSCDRLICTVDASGSTDVDGTIESYRWAFEDGSGGSAASGPTAAVSYPADGSYLVTLTVTDNRGSEANASRTMSVSSQVTEPPPVGVRNVTAVAGAASARPTITVPTDVQAGDTLVLFVSNGASRTPALPSGWTQLSTQSDVELRTDIYWRRATQADAGSSVAVDLLNSSGVAQSAPNTLTLGAYTGAAASPVSAVVCRAEPSTTSTGTHTTPAIDVGSDGSLVLSYWADRTSSTTSTSATTQWTPPLGQALRAAAYNTATGGRVTSLLTDDDAQIAAGARPGLTAVANGQTLKASMCSVVLTNR